MMTPEQLAECRWNDSSDDYNQWSNLSDGEKSDAINIVNEDLNILETMEDCLLWVEHEEDRARMESCIKIMQGRLK